MRLELEKKKSEMSADADLASANASTLGQCGAISWDLSAGASINDPLIDVSLPAEGRTALSQEATSPEQRNTTTPFGKRARGRPTKLIQSAVENNSSITDFFSPNRKRSADDMFTETSPAVSPTAEALNPSKKSNLNVSVSYLSDSDGSLETTMLNANLISRKTLPVKVGHSPESAASDSSLLRTLLRTMEEMKQSSDRNFALIRSDVAKNNELLSKEVFELRDALEREKNERAAERERAEIRFQNLEAKLTQTTTNLTDEGSILERINTLEGRAPVTGSSDAASVEMKEQLEVLNRKLELREARERRNNIVIRGINFRQEGLTSEVKDFLFSEFRVDKLRYWADKREILKRRFRFGGRNIYIDTDMS